MLVRAELSINLISLVFIENYREFFFRFSFSVCIPFIVRTILNQNFSLLLKIFEKLFNTRRRRKTFSHLIIIDLSTFFQWSLRSNLTPDSKDTCNCWREKESDDLMMLSSDSGITSPHSHHYDQQSVSPCSISVSLP